MPIKIAVKTPRARSTQAAQNHAVKQEKLSRDDIKILWTTIKRHCVVNGNHSTAIISICA